MIEWSSYGKEGLVEGTSERVKAIDGFDGYFVSSYGRVFSCRHRVGFGVYGVDYERPVELKQRENIQVSKKNFMPYKYVRLGGRKHKTTHRLVAEAFIENPNGLSVVNHLDEDCHNNRVDNLEWTTVSGNNKHSAHKQSKHHKLISPDGYEIIVEDLRGFCKTHSLHNSTLYIRGKTKGWQYCGTV